MKNILIDLLTSSIELLAITAGIWLAAVAASIGFLYVTRLYKVKWLDLAAPAAVALIFEVFGLIGYAGARQWSRHEWAYYLLAPPVLSALCVSGLFRKRLRGKGYHSGTV